MTAAPAAGAVRSLPTDRDGRSGRRAGQPPQARWRTRGAPCPSSTGRPCPRVSCEPPSRPSRTAQTASGARPTCMAASREPLCGSQPPTGALPSLPVARLSALRLRRQRRPATPGSTSRRCCRHRRHQPKASARRPSSPSPAPRRTLCPLRRAAAASSLRPPQQGFRCSPRGPAARRRRPKRRRAGGRLCRSRTALRVAPGRAAQRRHRVPPSRCADAARRACCPRGRHARRRPREGTAAQAAGRRWWSWRLRRQGVRRRGAGCTGGASSLSTPSAAFPCVPSPSHNRRVRGCGGFSSIFVLFFFFFFF
eukprot:Rhum_TRINITY_DN12012_c1_g1::Rhum_TRINITY_DN12012_c1_g1_i1::g.48770::m.48770